MKTPIHALTITIVVLVFAWLMIERAQADLMFDEPGIFESSVTPA